MLRLIHPATRIFMTSTDAVSSLSFDSTSSRVNGRVRQHPTSPYPLTVLKPSSSIPKFPLLTNGTSESDAFAEKTKDGSVLNSCKDHFRQAWKVAAISIPARESAAYQNSEQLKSNVLRIHKLKSLAVDHDDASKRILLFNVKSSSDLSKEAQELIEKDNISLSESKVVVDWDYWTVEEILSSLLPEGLPEGTPTAFTSTGHIAHLNLREEYSAYRFLIGQVILEKNRHIRTVVNKLDSIDNEFRFFKMERLAGQDEFEVTLSESSCSFTFDFRTVYWNSRLHTEHERLVKSFEPYEVISDVMAGVGPFAVPAAKKGVYVLANDLNPASYKSMLANSMKNKVQDRLRCYCEDGRAFIQESIRRCWNEPWQGMPIFEEDRKKELASKSAKGRGKQQHQALKGIIKEEIQRGPPRRLIDHFVMNLPGSALEFLDAFPGIYKSIAGEELEKELEREGARWPMVHVHCFTKNLEHPYQDICQRANERLNLQGDERLIPPPCPPIQMDSNSTIHQSQDVLDLAHLSLHHSPTPDLKLHYVRSVAPNKDMYCLSFRLNRRILFA